MNKVKSIFTVIIFGFFIQMLTSCGEKSKTEIKKPEKDNMTKKYNPVVYFEIPVNNMERAVKFYTSVLNFNFEREIIHSNEMALFPFADENTGITGALAKGEIYKPTKNGVLIYFYTQNINTTLKLVIANGGQILFPKTANGDLGFVAEFEDSEGNRIALHQAIN